MNTVIYVCGQDQFWDGDWYQWSVYFVYSNIGLECRIHGMANAHLSIRLPTFSLGFSLCVCNCICVIQMRYLGVHWNDWTLCCSFICIWICIQNLQFVFFPVLCGLCGLELNTEYMGCIFTNCLCTYIHNIWAIFVFWVVNLYFPLYCVDCVDLNTEYMGWPSSTPPHEMYLYLYF